MGLEFLLITQSIDRPYEIHFHLQKLNFINNFYGVMVGGREDIKVLGFWSSPYVIRVRIALRLRNLDYEYVEENLRSKSELLIKSNPIHKKVPVLIHNGKCISESLIILEYIDDAFPSGPSFLQSDPYDRATSRFWATYINNKLSGSLVAAMWPKTEEESKAALEEVKKGMELLEEAFVKMSKGKGYFGGERIGYLDIALGPSLPWIEIVEKFNNTKCVSEVLTPGLHGWAERFLSDAAVRDVMPDAQKCLEFAERLRSDPKASEL